MFKTNKTLDRMNAMLDRAIDGENIELVFDESKAAQIESKLHKYLMQTSAHKKALAEQKLRIDELISDISHQTKTPIANISLYSELLCECENQEDAIEYKAKLKNQTEKLNFLITSLVKTSRLENGIVAVEPKLQSVRKLLDNIRKSFPSVIVKNSDVCFNYDLKWTEEAISNIIENAIKYGSKKTKISVKEYELFARIDICDNGMGIAEEEIPKVFSRFYRGKNVQEQDGVGIGLYLAREIVSKQGGYIKVSSKLSQGSTFSVFLPR